MAGLPGPGEVSMRPKAIERIKIGRAGGRELTQQPSFDGGVDGRPGSSA